MTLIFFFLFSSLGLGLFWPKLALTLLDFTSGYLVGNLLYKENKHLRHWTFLLLCANPLMMWFTSHEGQFDSLALFLGVLSIYSFSRRNIASSAFIFALGLQVRPFLFLLVFYFIGQIFNLTRDKRSTLIRFSFGLLLGFILFSPFYFYSPLLYFSALQTQNYYSYNPFYWNFFDSSKYWAPQYIIRWYAFVTYFSLALLSAHLVTNTKKYSSTYLGAIGYIVLIKSLFWAQFWYWIVYPTMLLPLRKKFYFFSLLWILFFLFCLHSLSQLLGIAFSPHETPKIMNLFNENFYFLNNL